MVLAPVSDVYVNNLPKAELASVERGTVHNDECGEGKLALKRAVLTSSEMDEWEGNWKDRRRLPPNSIACLVHWFN